MKLVPIGSNMTILSSGNNTILYSYSTPVAACLNGKYYRTSKHWSMTTSRHINKWLNGRIAEYMSQASFDALSL